MNEHVDPQSSPERPPYAVTPDFVEHGDDSKKTEGKQVIKDERDENGNGYVEVFVKAAPVGIQGPGHDYKIGYQVSDKPSGPPGKQWVKKYEEDLGPVSPSDTIH